MSESFFEVSGNVGHGSLAINKLGHHNPSLNAILSRRTLDGYTTVSAHAPSSLKLILKSPALLVGFLNCSAWLQPANPVGFWADFNWLGAAIGPGDTSAEVRLGSGEHFLQAGCRADRNERRDSVWALKPAPTGLITPSPIPMPHNTAVVVIGAFPPTDVPRSITHLAYSARNQKVWLTVRGSGETYNHFDTKVLRLADWIAELPPIYQYVLYTDASDTVFIQPLAEICRSFQSMGCPLVISAEKCCFPVRSKDWKDRFPDHPAGWRWANAGVFMGEREAILNALLSLRNLSEQFAASEPPPHLEDIWNYRNFNRDDQFLWQVAHLKNLFPLALDYGGQIVANISCSDRSIPVNRDFAFDGGQVTVRSSGGKPGVLHFSGPRGRLCRDLWGGYLGAFQGAS